MDLNAAAELHMEVGAGQKLRLDQLEWACLRCRRARANKGYFLSAHNHDHAGLQPSAKHSCKRTWFLNAIQSAAACSGFVHLQALLLGRLAQGRKTCLVPLLLSSPLLDLNFHAWTWPADSWGPKTPSHQLSAEFLLIWGYYVISNITVILRNNLFSKSNILIRTLIISAVCVISLFVFPLFCLEGLQGLLATYSHICSQCNACMWSLCVNA